MQFSDTETKISRLIEPTINSLGFELVMINIINDGLKTLKVIIDGQNDVRLSINDCRSVSKLITPILDVENLVTGKYVIEVSSAGIERPLVKKADYDRFIGRQILVKLQSIVDDRKKYEGKLLQISHDCVILELGTPPDSINKTISFDLIKSANLVMTDEMFKAILKS